MKIKILSILSILYGSMAIPAILAVLATMAILGVLATPERAAAHEPSTGELMEILWDRPELLLGRDAKTLTEEEEVELAGQILGTMMAELMKEDVSPLMDSLSPEDRIIVEEITRQAIAAGLKEHKEQTGKPPTSTGRAKRESPAVQTRQTDRAGPARRTLSSPPARWPDHWKGSGARNVLRRAQARSSSPEERFAAGVLMRDQRPGNLIEAHKWFQLAGDQRAAQAIAGIQHLMSPADIAEAHHRYRIWKTQ